MGEWVEQKLWVCGEGCVSCLACDSGTLKGSVSEALKANETLKGQQPSGLP